MVVSTNAGFNLGFSDLIIKRQKSITPIIRFHNFVLYYAQRIIRLEKHNKRKLYKFTFIKFTQAQRGKRARSYCYLIRLACARLNITNLISTAVHRNSRRNKLIVMQTSTVPFFFPFFLFSFRSTLRARFQNKKPTRTRRSPSECTDTHRWSRWRFNKTPLGPYNVRHSNARTKLIH